MNELKNSLNRFFFNVNPYDIRLKDALSRRSEFLTASQARIDKSNILRMNWHVLKDDIPKEQDNDRILVITSAITTPEYPNDSNYNNNSSAYQAYAEFSNWYVVGSDKIITYRIFIPDQVRVFLELDIDVLVAWTRSFLTTLNKHYCKHYVTYSIYKYFRMLAEQYQ